MAIGTSPRQASSIYRPQNLLLPLIRLHSRIEFTISGKPHVAYFPFSGLIALNFLKIYFFLT
ncbi:hypothetical protein K503DRAFT_807188 [Rhizopogon vinicolor AM-OR11-026]|uniref:Uncharacterized protein n=1 Tax=Rhizopogon vinicolor AM-OR11-026 TaxID=1314800 RepID=A0A1B7MD21_9AGAM|nr:hypothetical protein K503DRAFT_807188 [Rhizopogon vinicolor AM-OR11-026]